MKDTLDDSIKMNQRSSHKRIRPTNGVEKNEPAGFATDFLFIVCNLKYITF